MRGRVCPVFCCIARLLPVILFSQSSPPLLPPSQPGPPSISVGACVHTHTHTHGKGLEGCSVHSPFQWELPVPFLATHGLWLMVTSTTAHFKGLILFFFFFWGFLFICSFETHVISLKYPHYFLFPSASMDQMTMPGSQ